MLSNECDEFNLIGGDQFFLHFNIFLNNFEIIIYLI